MRKQIRAISVLGAAALFVISSASAASAAPAPWDYKATMKSGTAIKGWAGVAREGLSYGTGKATVQGLTAGTYKFVLDTKAYDYINHQTNSSVVQVCTVHVPTNNATSSCTNPSLQLPYGNGLIGTAKLVGITGRIAAQGSISADPTHAPRVFSGQTGSNYVDLYGEHLGSTNHVYLQSGTEPKVSANFQIKDDHWVHITPPSLPSGKRYDVMLVTPYGSVTLDGWFRPASSALVAS